MKILSAFAIGLIFGLGIAVSGMIDPAKVLNFFDFAGTWDPSLAFVMGGALVVTAVGYRFVLKAPHPAFANSFSIPTRRDIDLRLVGGAATFGIGWGLSGFCPGGVVPALGIGRVEPWLFVAAVIAGMLVANFVETWRLRSAHPA